MHLRLGAAPLRSLGPPVMMTVLRSVVLQLLGVSEQITFYRFPALSSMIVGI